MKAYPDKMSSEQARAFQAAVLDIVRQIPRGRVTTYGTIAAWAGWPSHSRMVGRTLRYSPEAQSLPCHRVVNAAGRTAPGWASQRTMLEAEAELCRDAPLPIALCPHKKRFRHEVALFNYKFGKK